MESDTDIAHPAIKTLVEYSPHLLLDEAGIPEIKHIAEMIKLELGDRLKGLRVSISDIEGVESRFVLLIGSDDDLLDAVAAYIYCLRSVNGCTGLYYQSFRGKPDDYLANELTTKDTFKNDTTIRQYEAIANKEGSCRRVSTTGTSTGYPRGMDGDLLDHVRQGRSVFLDNLKYPNSLLLEGIGKKIAGIKTHWDMYRIDKRGLLIVSTRSEKDLPEYFVEQFEVIDFSSKQAQPAGQATPGARNTTGATQDAAKHQATTTPKVPNEIYYDGSKGMLFVENDSVELTPTEKVFFEYFWNKDGSVGVDDVIEYMTMLHELKGTTWNIGYFNKTKTTINTKCKILGVAKLIRNLAKKEYELSIKVKSKVFKS
ncbi:MAG: hypothetical protein HW406_554 [Candidatus Brocadiaceae bacterium]|nr:hypothetical protein [Candidatus Brocadiaceae bacterium]